MSLRLDASLPVAALGMLVACSPGAPLDRARVDADIAERYPDVARISTAQLAERMSGETGEAPVILDARAPEEHAVSHIRGAAPAPDEAAALHALDGASRDAKVVVYCSVGYRSADLARRLGALGFTDVRNLEGSIFAWANEGRPLFRGDRPVRAVHPYNKRWGTLLDRDLWSYAPEAED